MHAQSLQLYLTLWDPTDHSLPDSSVCGIFLAIPEWVAMSSSRGSSWPWDQTPISCVSCIAGGFFTTEPPGSLGRKITCSISDKEYLSQDRTKDFVSPEIMGFPFNSQLPTWVTLTMKEALRHIWTSEIKLWKKERRASLVAQLVKNPPAMKEGKIPTFKLSFEVGHISKLLCWKRM